MPLTRESEYALLGLKVLLGRTGGESVSVAEIAAAQDLPQPFLAKVFLKLAQSGILASRRGRGHGYRLAREPAEVLVRDVIEAVEGSAVLERCFLWEGHCHDANPCPLHFRFKALLPEFRAVLESVTLADYFANGGHTDLHS